MYSKVVVPLDGSPLAEVALPYAEEIAGKMDSEMILLSVLASEEPEEYRTHYTYTKKIIEHTRRQVEKYHNDEKNGAIKIGAATRVGSPAEGILNYISSSNTCLTVMATHGRSGVSRWAVGSVADKIVRATIRQPLLLIRAKGIHPDVRAKRIIKKALVPLDGSENSEAVIQSITEIALRLQMEILLLRVVQKNHSNGNGTEEYLKEWCLRLEDKGISANYAVRTGAPADEIIDLADEVASDLVAMSTRGQTTVGLWPLGSVAQKVLLGGNTPLLMIKA
jgi:nucleotide-binding universal stress UspA family protein